MSGETNLNALLRVMVPDVLPAQYVFCTVPEATYGDLSHTTPLACFRETEGLTLVLPKERADQQGLHYQGVFRCISLQVHSSLNAVGLTAAISSKLAAHGIPANMMAGYYHDHILVPSANVDSALKLLRELSSEA